MQLLPSLRGKMGPRVRRVRCAALCGCAAGLLVLVPVCLPLRLPFCCVVLMLLLMLA